MYMLYGFDFTIESQVVGGDLGLNAQGFVGRGEIEGVRGG